DGLRGPAPDLPQQPPAPALDAISRNAQLSPTPPSQSAPTQRTPGELSSTLPSSTVSSSPRDGSHEPHAVDSTMPAASASHAEGQTPRDDAVALPPLNSAAGLVREAASESLTPNI